MAAKNQVKDEFSAAVEMKAQSPMVVDSSLPLDSSTRVLAHGRNGQDGLQGSISIDFNTPQRVAPPARLVM